MLCELDLEKEPVPPLVEGYVTWRKPSSISGTVVVLITEVKVRSNSSHTIHMKDAGMRLRAALPKPPVKGEVHGDVKTHRCVLDLEHRKDT
jgi:hypothetical protein